MVSTRKARGEVCQRMRTAGICRCSRRTWTPPSRLEHTNPRKRHEERSREALAILSAEEQRTYVDHRQQQRQTALNPEEENQGNVPRGPRSRLWFGLCVFSRKVFHRACLQASLAAVATVDEIHPSTYIRCWSLFRMAGASRSPRLPFLLVCMPRMR